MPRVILLSSGVRVEPETTERESAAQIAQAVGTGQPSVMLQLPDGTSIPLPQSLVEVLRVSAEELADGHVVTVRPSEVSLSPPEVAELVGLSGPFVVRLLDEGEIPSSRLPRSRHRLVWLCDAVAFQARRDRRRRGRQDVTAIVEEAGLPY